MSAAPLSILDEVYDLAEQPTLVDARRITEHDADFRRLHARTARALKASVQALVRDLRRDPHDTSGAQSRFIQRHMDLLRRAYIAAHREGQRDYYTPVSRTPRKWLLHPPSAQVQKRLAWYGLGSVLRMAHEAATAVQAERHQTLSAGAETAYTFADSPVDQYLAGVNVRADLQANIAWSGLQDGYLFGGTSDRVTINSLVYWVLEPAAKHCADCPDLADGSPYNAPGLGGNELPATPGDGYTDCGAGCKCSLEYRSAAYLDTMVTDKLLRAAGQSGILDNALLDQPQLPEPPTPPSDGALSRNQQRALDLYRATTRAWAEWTAGTPYPTLPPFLVDGAAADWNGWTAWESLDWNTLPPKLRVLMQQALEARLLWATPDGMEG